MTDPSRTIELTQSDLIFLHSPLNILAQFALLVQERFSQGNLPWAYSDNENETGIFIHTDYNMPEDTANAAPRVVVSSGTIVHEKTVLGDIGPGNTNLLPREAHRHFGLCNGDVQIQCVSEAKGEAAIIGDIVQSLVGMTRKEICKQFQLRDIGAVVLQPPKPWDRDKQKWQTSVQFRLNWEHHWVTFPIAPELKQATFYTDSQLDGLGYIKNAILRDDVLPQL